MIKELEKKLKEKYPKSRELIKDIIKEVEEYYRKRAKESYQRNKEKVKKRTARKCDYKRFGGKRELILERDNWQCQDCGMTNEQHILIFGKNLTIHHIDGKGRNSKKPNNNPDNLITLCMRCHGKRDSTKSLIKLNGGKTWKKKQFKER